MNDLINAELSDYKLAYYKLMEVLEKDREYLQKKVNEGKITEKYLNYRNHYLTKIHTYIDGTQRLLQAISLYYEIVGEEDTESLKYKICDLENENKKLRAWLKSLGKDISLLPYFRESDLQYA